MDATMLRIVARLGRRTRFDVVDPAGIADAPWWAVDALRATGFEPAASVRLKPRLLPAQTTLLLTHVEDRVDARIGFMRGSPEPTVGLTSWFGRWSMTTGQTGRGPLAETLHQAFAGAPPLELVGHHREALAFLAARGVRPEPLDPSGAPDRYRTMWMLELEAIRAMPRPRLDAMARDMQDGGALRGVPLALQPDIEERLAAMVANP